MANTVIKIEEVRFDLRNEQLTGCYVFINNLSNDGLLGVHGWHYKSFPATITIMDILKGWEGGDDPLLWPQQAPKT